MYSKSGNLITFAKKDIDHLEFDSFLVSSKYQSINIIILVKHEKIKFQMDNITTICSYQKKKSISLI